jgi:hypothetical protein
MNANGGLMGLILLVRKKPRKRRFFFIVANIACVNSLRYY